MRIDKIEIQNFKRFEKQTLELHPHFTLLVGDNGAGKTTLLDALAVAAAVWLVKVPDSTLASSGRNILTNGIRLDRKKEGDRIQFNECKPVAVLASGQIAGRDVQWCRQIRYDFLRSIAQAGGSTKGALTCGYLKTHLIPIPSIAEQIEIVSTFNALDQKEKVATRKRGQFQDLFRTLLHELMTAKTRVTSI